jgi:hypothetical protein
MKNNITIRMGAAYWDVRVRGADGKVVTFDHRKMSKDDKRIFHRELMNAWRSNAGSRA